jgi:hypothetical protein
MGLAKPSLLSALAAVLLSIGCTAAPGGMGAMPPPGADGGAPAAIDATDALPPVADALADRSSASEAGAAEGANESREEVAAADASSGDGAKPWWPSTQPWPAPGTEYLSKLETEAQFDQLRGTRGGLPFIIRRLANGAAFPYPWDGYECVFESGMAAHLEFLEKIDPTRALGLYYGDAKSPDGSLIPGRLSLDKTKTPNVMVVGFENERLISPTDTFFPLDPAVFPLLRERIKRCVPFVSAFTYSMLCPGKKTCPLP